MEKEFCSYKIALKLKELGFDELCFAGWFNYLHNKQCLIYKDSIYGKEYGENIMLRNSSDVYQLEPENKHSIVAGNCTSPLCQQVIDWFREKHNIHIIIFPLNDLEDIDDYKSPHSKYNPIIKKYTYSIYPHLFTENDGYIMNNEYNSSYEAMNAGINKVIEIIKEEKNLIF